MEMPLYIIYIIGQVSNLNVGLIVDVSSMMEIIHGKESSLDASLLMGWVSTEICI